MTMPHNLFNSLQSFEPNSGKAGQFYSLPQLEKEGIGKISRLPVSIRIVLESVLRNCDGRKITEDDVRAVANSHATMINGLGIVGWGVGGIEAEAAMLGQPVYFLTPDVVGVHMSGKLRES